MGPQIQGGSRLLEIDRELKGAEAVVVLWTGSRSNPPGCRTKPRKGATPAGWSPSRSAMPACRSAFVSSNRRPRQWNGTGEPTDCDELLAAIAKIASRRLVGKHRLRLAEDKATSATSVCVLPFVNMSGDPEQEYFSDGITEDIITDLSKVSACSVVARNTAFTFKGQSMDVKEVAAALGVSHVLEGSVRKAGNRVRITAQLIDGRPAIISGPTATTAT